MSELDDARAEMARNTDALDRLLAERARLSPFPRDRVCLVPTGGDKTCHRPSGTVIAFPRRLRVIEGGA
jgi:hypothetical protein